MRGFELSKDNDFAQNWSLLYLLAGDSSIQAGVLSFSPPKSHLHLTPLLPLFPSFSLSPFSSHFRVSRKDSSQQIHNTNSIPIWQKQPGRKS